MEDRKNENITANELAKMMDDLSNKLLYKNFMWEGYKFYDHYFTYDKKEEFFGEIYDYLLNMESSGYPVIIKKGIHEYFNIPASFDIETSSWYEEEEKRAAMYIWQFGFNGSVIVGRTWDEFMEFMQEIHEKLELSKKRTLLIFVHNLSYEFQFIRKLFEWDKVFSIKKRRPVYAKSLGFEFRCSLLLSNYALEYVGDKVISKYKVKKQVGKLDYSKIRHSETPLTNDEMLYCIDDVRVVMSYIQEKIEQDGGIINIPLTNTGYVRRFCRNKCMANKLQSQKYHELMQSLQIRSEQEYDQLKRAFMGGFTHASILHANEVCEDVGSADLTSSYPYQMVSNYYPMTQATYIGSPSSEEEFIKLLETKCCIFDVYFYNLEASVEYENYLSISRCICTGEIVNNGRIVSAVECQTTLTEIDFEIVQSLYRWEYCKIENLRVYDRGYLPKPLIEAILELYGNKTRLKDIPEEAVEYMRSKNMVNASFGMMVTDIIRPEFVYDENDEWSAESPESLKTKQLSSYNRNFNRFLYYAWGVYVTAHARYALFQAINEFKEDYIYADTDSIKGYNFDKHKFFFTRYNMQVEASLLEMCNFMKIPFSAVSPANKLGDKKTIGVWEIEKPYKRFKTCGAKRYMFEYYDNEMSLTVSGLKKKDAMKWLLEEFDGSHTFIFNYFRSGMWIPAGHTGKQTVTFIDEEHEGFITDYLGNCIHYEAPSAIHMEPQSYFMSQTKDYLDLISGVREDPNR